MMRTSSMKIIGNDANGKNLCVCHFECDSASDLPAYNVYQSDGYVFVMSSTAHTIDTDKKYELSSSGTWVEQSQPWQPLADYSVLANKPQINGYTLTGNQSGADLGLQNALTFDITPTQNSTNPVTSGGIWTDQQRQETEIGVVANAGAKNLLNPDDYIKNSTGGLTITETGTGTYKITGTPSGTVDVYTTQSGTFDRMYGLEAGKTYTISGLPTGNGLLCRIDVSKNNSGSWDAQIISNLKLPQTFTVPSDATGLYIRYRVTTSATIPSGGISLEPMIRPAAITDPTFQPFARTNRELTVLTDEDRAALVKVVDSGAKNFLNANGSFYSETNGWIVGSGARTGIDCNIPAGDYYLSITVDGQIGSGAIAQLQVLYVDDTVESISNILSLVSNASSSKQMLFSKNVIKANIYFTGTPATIKNIMICATAAWKISHAYQPYRPSWQEMYDMILALQ